MKRRPHALVPILLMLALLTAVASSASHAEAPEVLRVACVQMEVKADIGANLRRIEVGIEEAHKAGARMVLFPETALSGFTEATIAKLDWDRVDAGVMTVAAAARRHEVYVLYGCATRSGKDRPFNSAILVGPDGQEVMRYHKMAPESWFAPGDHLAYFEVDGIPSTMIICHDNRFPELVRLPVLHGAQLCFYISYEINDVGGAVRKIDNYRSQLVGRAVENGIWVVQSNGVGPLPSADHVSLGQSRIVNPAGVIVAEAPGMQDAMIVEDITPASARRGNAIESLEIQPLAEWWRQGLKLLEAPPE